MYQQEYRWSTPPVGKDIIWIKYLGGETMWASNLPPDFKVGTITWALNVDLSRNGGSYHLEDNRFKGNFSSANFEVLSTSNFYWGDRNVIFVAVDSPTESSTSHSMLPPDSTSDSSLRITPTLIQGLKNCIQTKTYVYCKNEEESTLYRTVMASVGYTWRSGTSYMNKDLYFNTQFEGIIYNPERGTYVSHLGDCSRDFFVLFEDLSTAGILASRYIVCDRLNKDGFIKSPPNVEKAPILDSTDGPTTKVLRGLLYCIDYSKRVYCKDSQESQRYREAMDMLDRKWVSEKSYLSTDNYSSAAYLGILYNPVENTYIKSLEIDSYSDFVRFQDLESMGAGAPIYNVGNNLSKHGFSKYNISKEIQTLKDDIAYLLEDQPPSFSDERLSSSTTYTEEKPSYTPDLIMQPITINLTTKTKNKWTIK